MFMKHMEVYIPLVGRVLIILYLQKKIAFF